MKHTLLAFSCLMLMVTGCIKDTLETTYTYTMARPVYKTSAGSTQFHRKYAISTHQRSGKNVPVRVIYFSQRTK